ncbi:hypothetical protein EET67_24365 [Pseudaminobacter arsenicus]|uniref:DUF2269 family protein n=1 Tax=Borborobacter arsenicus TaxID=1851146 RepID=A0A432UZB7_9HYPH|nr:hypothetical protein [Pseudaminobacter arsenicus]RUM95245.1 hypothetical protein EET67_24365 [Pseudaminobacter arsenicus]
MSQLILGTLHLFAAIMFVGTVFFEVLMLEAIRKPVGHKAMRVVETEIGRRTPTTDVVCHRGSLWRPALPWPGTIMICARTRWIAASQPCSPSTSSSHSAYLPNAGHRGQTTG